MWRDSEVGGPTAPRKFRLGNFGRLLAKQAAEVIAHPDEILETKTLNPQSQSHPHPNPHPDPPALRQLIGSHTLEFVNQTSDDGDSADDESTPRHVPIPPQGGHPGLRRPPLPSVRKPRSIKLVRLQALASLPEILGIARVPNVYHSQA